MAVEYFLVPSIFSNHCVRAISDAVGALPGVRLVVVSLGDKRVRVEHDRRASVEALIQAIKAAGYDEVAVLG